MTEDTLLLSKVMLAVGNRILLSDFDLQVREGQLVGLTGESGCGKTSLLRAVLGFVPISAGTIEVCGLPLDIHHIREIRRTTAYVPQELQPPADTGRDLVHLTHDLAANSSLVSQERFSEFMRALNLEDSLLELNAAKLSGGQRQRLLLAAALATSKPLLLLDEPSSALDEESTQRMALALLRVCHEGKRSALIVSHDAVLLRFCDKVVHL